jgi:hypothetical protein
MLGALTFGIAIPTQGGVGTYEWFGQQALSRFFGVDPSTAAAAILVMHVFAVGPVIIMGFGFLWKEGLSFSGLTSRTKVGGDAASAYGGSDVVIDAPVIRAPGEGAAARAGTTTGGVAPRDLPGVDQ